MLPNLEELRKNYERFDDNKLIRLATEEASELRPEAVDLLKQIIKERGLSEDIVKGIDVQIQEIDNEKLSEYIGLLRELPCPVCKSSSEKLNATMTASVISFLILTNYEKELKIACPNCLDSANTKAIIKSALLGWWGFPWGIIRTTQALLFNDKMKKQNRLSEPNDLLRGFVLERIGRIEASRNNISELQEIVERIR
jgi:hypothetical protein